jgi:hypothetical protein
MDAATTILAFEVADIGTTRALFAMAAVIFILFILNRSARRRRMGLARPRDEQPTHGETARVQRLKREMEQLLVELNDFARDVNGQIDTRFAKLEKSIADADRRIAELRRLEGDAGGSSDIDRRVLRANADAAAAIRGESAAGQSHGSSRQLIETEASGEERVYELSDMGRTPTEIARLMRCTVGEVELILNLRGRR